MPTYDMPVSDELLPDFVSAAAKLPENFRVIGPAEGPSEPGTTRVRVQDDAAPAWTEGKLISAVFSAAYELDDAGQLTSTVSRVTVSDWREVIR